MTPWSPSRHLRSVATRAFLAAATLAGGLLGLSSRADALPPITSPMGGAGQVAIDQISGFRVSTNNGLNYYGPIGVDTRSITRRDFDPRVTTDGTVHQTSFWLAPSADYFLFAHFSLGALIEVSTTSSSVDTNINGRTTTVPQATTTNFTFLPRAGWLFPITERFGIWPRAGIGYVSRQSLVPTGNLAETFSGFAIDLDVGFLFRVANGWFFKAAPELSFVPGGSHSLTAADGTSQSASASAFQFAIVSGVGVFLDL